MPRVLCPSMVGRESELGHLIRSLDHVVQGAGCGIVVRGPAGIGKSRLLREIREAAERRGACVLAGRCVPSAVPVPYRPLGEALITATSATRLALAAGTEGFGAALGWIVPAWREEGAIVPPESPIVVAEAFLRAGRALATRGGTVFVIEDLQWADPETLHALEYLADHLAGIPFLVLASMRDEARGDAPAMVARLAARRAAEVIDLGPLSSAEVAEMAARSLGAAVLPEELVALLEERAEGVPFLVEELLATAAIVGALVREGDRWRPTRAVRSLIPESFAVTVRERLHGMAPEGRRLLGAAALLGRSFDWRLAMAATGLSAAASAAILEQAVGFQLIAVQEDGFGFRHALTREAVLAELLPHERSELAARCLTVVEDRPESLPQWRQLAADLAEFAGDAERAAQILLDAGRASLASGALETAGAGLRRALGLTRSAALRAEVLEALAETAGAAGDLRGTERAVASMLEALVQAGAARERRGVAHLLLARSAVAVTHFETAREELARARRFAEDDGASALLARVTAVEAQLAVGDGRAPEAERLAGKAAAAAEATRQPGVVCEALEVASRCARTRDLEEAREIAERALVVAEGAGLAYWRMRALYQLGVVDLFRSSDVAGLERARAEARRLGAVATAASLDVEITAGLEVQHRLDEARETCERCLGMAGLLELRGLEAVAHLFMAVIESRGSRTRMEEAIDRGLRLGGDDVELRGAAWGDARAIASLSAEDRARARRELQEAAAVYGTAPPTTLPRLGMALLTTLDAVEGLDPNLGAVSGATRLNAQGAAYLAYAEAAVLGRHGEGGAALQAFQRGERALHRAPWYRNLMRRLVAEAAVRDRWGEPVTWLDEATRFFEGCGDGRLASACRGLLQRAGARVARPTRAARTLPPALRQAGVTPREAEVLALVGDGLPNREIAARLSLSVRTVEQHVAWLKRKLGLRTRAQLAVQAAVLEGRGA